MDYEISFDQEVNSYRIYAGFEFSAIADWITEYVTDLETTQRVLSAARIAMNDKETTNFSHGPFDVVMSEEGVVVTRKVDMAAAEDEIKAMFDSQDSFYRTSTEGVQAECGLEDMINMVESWFEVQQ